MRLIDADALMLTFNDWWYSSFGQEENEQSLTIKEAMKAIEDAPTVDAVEVVKDMLKGEMRLIDAVQGEKMSNQRVIEWIPIRERKPHLPGIYLVTAQVFTGDILSTAAHFTPNGFLLDGVIAWAELPKPYEVKE